MGNKLKKFFMNLWTVTIGGRTNIFRYHIGYK